MDVRVSDCGLYSFLRISCSYLVRNYSYLLNKNKTESGFFKEKELEINIEKYSNLEISGKVYCFLIIHYSNVIGYGIILFSSFLHFDSIENAYMDTIFIKKQYRGLPIFRKTLSFIEDICRFYNVKHLFFSSMTDKRIDNLLKRYKFQEREIIFYKELM